MLQITKTCRHYCDRDYCTTETDTHDSCNERQKLALETEDWSNWRLFFRRRSATNSTARICFLRGYLHASCYEHWRHPAQGKKSCARFIYFSILVKLKDLHFIAAIFRWLLIQGTLLLKPLEENTILLYSLHGRSLPPQASAQINRRFPAKMKYTELLPVHNWLNTQQRFRCDIELLNSEDLESEVWHL